MLKIVSCIHCLNKGISIGFTAIFVSFKCACNCEVIFHRNSPVEPGLVLVIDSCPVLFSTKFEMWDVGDVRCSDVGCWRCRMLGMWNV